MVLGSLLSETALAALLLSIASVSAHVGTVRVQNTSSAVGVGGTWGDGELTYRGKTSAFSISGLSVVDPGTSKATASGDVLHMTKLSDFPGTYVAAHAVVGGAGTVVMRNQNGVVMQLIGTGVGMRLSPAATGVEVKLK